MCPFVLTQARTASIDAKPRDLLAHGGGGHTSGAIGSYKVGIAGSRERCLWEL